MVEKGFFEKYYDENHKRIEAENEAELVQAYNNTISEIKAMQEKILTALALHPPNKGYSKTNFMGKDLISWEVAKVDGDILKCSVRLFSNGTLTIGPNYLQGHREELDLVHIQKMEDINILGLNAGMECLTAVLEGMKAYADKLTVVQLKFLF